MLNIINARVLTLAGAPEPRRGRDLHDLGVIANGFVRIDEGRIVDVGEMDALAAAPGSSEPDTIDDRPKAPDPAFKKLKKQATALAREERKRLIREAKRR